MRILFYRYNSICEADIINVFEENTFEVDSITEEMENKELEAAECLKMVSEALEKPFLFYYKSIKEKRIFHGI